MDTEFEAKFYPVEKPRFREKLKTLGAVLILPECKMRRTLLQKRHHPEFICSYIRVRDEGNLVRLSAKMSASPGGKLTDQKEVDVIVNDYDKTVQILESMGFKFDAYQENLREIWHYEEAEVVIDTWPGLDPYSEIEAKSETQVMSIAEKLGFDWSKKNYYPGGRGIRRCVSHIN